MKHTVDTPEFCKLVEKQLDDSTDLLVGIELDGARRQLDIPHRHSMKHLTPLGFVEPAPIKAIAHRL